MVQHDLQAAKLNCFEGLCGSDPERTQYFATHLLARELSPLGLRLLEDLSGDDIWRRYCTESEAALRSPTVRIARACAAR